MSAILDTMNQPLTHVSFQQVENSDSAVLVIRVPCVTGQFLTADDVIEARVLARKNGTADTFVDLASLPIDLAPYDGMDADFDVKVHTNAVTGIVPTAIGVRVTYNP